MLLQGLHSNIPRPLTLQRRSFLHKKLHKKNIGNVLASEIWTFCVDIINESDWNCGYSKEELAFSSHLRHLESQLECYNLQRQNYLVTDIEITRASRPSSSRSQNRFSIHMKLRCHEAWAFSGVVSFEVSVDAGHIGTFIERSVDTQRFSNASTENIKTKKWVFKKIYMATHQVYFSLHFTCGSWLQLSSFESSSYRRKRDISIVWIHYKTQSVGYFLHFSGLGWFPFTNLSNLRSSGEMGTYAYESFSLGVFGCMDPHHTALNGVYAQEYQPPSSVCTLWTPRPFRVCFFTT